MLRVSTIKGRPTSLACIGPAGGLFSRRTPHLSHRRVFADDRPSIGSSVSAAARLTGGMDGIRITAIKAYPAWVGIRNQLLVKVETDDGVYGWGESGLSGRERAVIGALEHYAQIIEFYAKP